MSEESIAEESAKTNVPAYSINHPGGRDTGEKGHALKYDRFEHNRSSESRLDPTRDTTDNTIDVLDDTSEYDRPVKSDPEIHDEGTTDDPAALITITTDDSEKESVKLNPAPPKPPKIPSLGKRYIIHIQLICL